MQEMPPDERATMIPTTMVDDKARPSMRPVPVRLPIGRKMVSGMSSRQISGLWY